MSMVAGALAGAIGGIAGTFALNSTQRLWTRAADNGAAPASVAGMHDAREWQERQEQRNANELAAAGIAARAGSGPLTRHELAAGAMLMHFLVGASVGALYGALASRRHRPRIADGVGVGLALWAAGDEVAMPLLGLSRPTTERPIEMHLQSLTAHLAYGMVTALVRDALGPRLPGGGNGAARGRGTGHVADRGSDTRRQLGGAHGIRVDQSVTIARSVPEVYRFWRNLENLPRFMEHLESVSLRGDGVSHWVAKGPAGTRVEWDARIINEVENTVIGWQSLEGSTISTAGSVTFEDTPHGTRVTVTLQYNPPAGKLGAAVARLFREEPGVQVREDLRRFKQILEAGEVPTIAGQPSGRAARSMR